MSAGARTALRLGVGLLVSAACLWAALHGTDWRSVGRMVGDADGRWVAAAVAASFVALLARAWRWAWLLRPVARVPAMEATSATAVGIAASAVLPLRLGELVRPALLTRRTDVPFSAALASVVVERVLDLLVILLCFVALSSIHPLPAGMRAAAWTGAIGASAGFAALLAVQWSRPASERMIDGVLAPLPAALASRAGALVRGVLDGAAAVADPLTALVVVAQSALVWGAVVLVYVCLLLALGIAAPPVAAGLASVVIVAAFVALPQAPGFVGTWQAGCVVALGLFAVPDHAAVGYALLTWIVALGSSLLFGGIFAAFAGLGPGDVLRARDGAVDRRAT